MVEDGLLLLIVCKLYGEFGARDAYCAGSANCYDVPFSAGLQTSKRMFVFGLAILLVVSAGLGR